MADPIQQAAASWQVWMPAIAAIIALLGAAYVAWTTQRANAANRKLTTELKIAEFRQAWINNLRDAMAGFQSYGVLPDNDPTKHREFFELGTKIELMMNPNDEAYPELADALYNFLFAADGSPTEKYVNNSEFVNICQDVLKREWERLKSDLRDVEAGRNAP